MLSAESVLQIPRHIKPPCGIELKVSLVDTSRIGTFTVNDIKKDTEFGPYLGRIVYDKDNEDIDPKYSWEVFDLKTFKYLHTIDATNEADGNWMRYICCARYFEEQNIVSMQNGTDVYYKALKDIASGEELLTWFQPKKKKKRRSSCRKSLDVFSTEEQSPSLNSRQMENQDSTPKSPGKMKRQRKPKIIPDSYSGPFDFYQKRFRATKQSDGNILEPLQPGQKRRRKRFSDALDSSCSSKTGSPKSESDFSLISKKPGILLRTNSDKSDLPVSTSSSKKSRSVSWSSSENVAPEKAIEDDDSKLETVIDGKKGTGGISQSIAEINSHVEWNYPPKGDEFLFELKNHHVIRKDNKKLYKCDICMGLYKHMFSLKRHYLRNHINYKYVSKADITNCLINLSVVVQNMKDKLPEGLDLDNSENVDDIKHADENGVGNDKICNGGDLIADNALEDDQMKATAKAPDSQVVDTEKEVIDTKKEVIDTEKDRILVNCVSTDFKARQAEMKKSHAEAKIICEADILNDDDTCSKSGDDGKPTDSNLKESNEELDTSFESLCSLKSKESMGDRTDTTQANRTEEKSKVKEDIAHGSLRPGLFKCYTCYRVFNHIQDIRSHVQNHPEQAEGTVFSCTQCSMRFNYKQNLVRHKRSHDSGAGPSIQKHASPPKQSKATKRPLLKSKVGELEHFEISAEKPLPSIDDRTYRCGKCAKLFTFLQAMKEHVQKEHTSGSKYQCQYCGKDFLSMPNMKKHVRFHLGYRASCKECTDTFSNVGALRKHTRLAHPEIYKAKLLERLEKFGFLRGPDKKKKSVEKLKKVKIEKVKELVKKAKEITVLTEETAKKKDKDFIPYSEFGFTADEIDDGGSRFKFSCTVCKKRFSSYINMCRHRRRTHGSESRHRVEQCLTFSKRSVLPVLENPAVIAEFYAGVSHNIATNLNCFIDGKPEHLEKFVEHIKIEDYKGNFGYSTEQVEPLDLTWEKYNFPQGFKPVKTISFAEIKNVLDIHNDFDSHCCPLDTETKNCDTQDISTEVTEQSEGDLKDKQPEEITTVDMGYKSQGFRILSSLGSVLGLKEPPVPNSKQQESKYINVKITNGQITSEYPAAKTVIQVRNGEFSNFPESVMCDLDSPVQWSVQQSTKCEMARNRSYIHGQDGKVHVDDVPLEVLNKRAQDEINALYEDIEEQLKGTEPSSCIQSSPKPLSVLCERLLGLHACKSKTVCDISKAKSGIEVLEKLCLSSNCDKEKSNFTEDIHSNGPDYSNFPEDSPFYNYDTIAFGKHGHIESICAVCTKHFKDIDSLLRHHWKKHPASVCNFLEVEHGNEIEKLHFTQPSYVGAIAVTDPGLESIEEMDSFRCTRCEIIFNSITKLHMHILNCWPLDQDFIDPICKWSKIDRSSSRTPLKKKLQKKLNHVHSVQGVKSNLDFGSLKQDGQKSAVLLQKRVFTGCRKRTSIILPDSPVKTIVDPKLQLPAMSGYNPNNHVRRRELKEVMDTLTCKACGLKFKTIILLERHVKHCSKKEKFKDVQPMSCPIMDESLAKLKNVCCYCDKNFTYTKSLANHLLDFCPVKKAKMDQGKVTDVDKQNEAFMIDRIQKLEDKKNIKDKDSEDQPKRTMTWQMGRKSKRKGHAWTNIKKRYLKNIDTDKNEAEFSNETDGIEKNVPDTNCADEIDSMRNDEIKLENPDFVNADITNNYFEKFEIVNNEKIVENTETVSKESCVDIIKEIGVEETLLTDLCSNSLTSTARYTVSQELSSSVNNKPEESEKASDSVISASKQVTKLLDCAKLPASLPERGVVLGKRKHERVGKVEEFLKNAFRKRRSNKEAVNHETGDLHSKGTSHNALQIFGEMTDTTISCDNQDESEIFTATFEALQNKQSGIKIESNSLTSTETNADTVDSQLTKVHRGRGRPKLSQNLQDIIKTEDVSRPRGRPRIHELKTLSSTSKRKPGRPPKSQAKVPVTHVKDQSTDLFAKINDSKHVSDYEHVIDESDQKEVDDNEIANCNSDDVMNGSVKKCVNNDEVDGDCLKRESKDDTEHINISMIQKNTLKVTNEPISISCKECTGSDDCIAYLSTVDKKGVNITNVRKAGAYNLCATNTLEIDKCEVITKLENSNTNDLNDNFLHFEVVSSEVNKISNETDSVKTDTSMATETSCLQTDTNMAVDSSCMQNASEYVCLHNESSNSEYQETEALQSTLSNCNEDCEEKVTSESENDNFTKKSTTNASKSNTNIVANETFGTEMSRVSPPADYKDTCSEGNYLDMNKSHSSNLEYTKEESISWNLHGNNTGINDKNLAKESINDEMLVSCANKVTEDICDKKINIKEGKFDLVLSPSERVKMNKRCCKKDVELSSAIWVKGTEQSSVKTENKNINTFKEIKKTESVPDRNNTTSEHTGKRPVFKKGNNQCGKLQISSANIISLKQSTTTTSSKCRLNNSTFSRGKKRKIYKTNESDT